MALPLTVKPPARRKHWQILAICIAVLICGLALYPFGAILIFPYPNARVQLCPALGRWISAGGWLGIELKHCLSTPDKTPNISEWCVSQGWRRDYGRDYSYCLMSEQYLTLGPYIIGFGQSANIEGYVEETKIFITTALVIKPAAAGFQPAQRVSRIARRRFRTDAVGGATQAWTMF